MSKLGSALNSGQGIELGSMSNSTRNNAGVTTAVGTLIYNSDTEAIEAYGSDGWVKVKTLDGVSATGGTKSDTERSNYVTHTFTSPGTFTSDGNLNDVEILVVAGGGGGGGSKYGGGGGAGGVYTRTYSSMNAVTNFTVTVGPGGAAGTNGQNAGGTGFTGGDSSFGPSPSPYYALAKGGGRAGSGYTPSANGPGGNGGSGGGAGSPGDTADGGTATQPSQNPGKGGTNSGFRGGNYDRGSSGYCPCGGGGASAAGIDSPPPGVPGGGNGGDGISSSISGTSIFYGGGGGASIYYQPNAPHRVGRGGNGGGGNGASPVNATNGSSPGINGVANRGGGGGGAHAPSPSAPYNNSTTDGGNGGSGIVIIAYPSITNNIV